MTQEWFEKNLKTYTLQAKNIKGEMFDKIRNHPILSDSCKEKLLELLLRPDAFNFDRDLANEIRNTINMSLVKENRCYDREVWKQVYDDINVDKYISIIIKISNLPRYLDSDPVEFDGDIIITDPCYIMRPFDRSTEPKWEDYMGTEDYTGKSQKELKEMGFFEKHARLDEAQRKWNNEHPRDWELCNYGDNMEVFGFGTYMTRDTIYGDWGCSVFDTISEKKIGSFCADAGLVSVFHLADVMKYNPDYNDITNAPHCVTLIKDFKGTVQFIVTEHTGVYKHDIGTTVKAGDPWIEYCVSVVGKGINKVTGKPLHFKTTQTGL